MRVILREDLDNLGAAGEVVTVRDGYGRNYLLPRGLASVATEKDVAKMEHERRVIASRAAKLAKELAGEVEKLSAVSVSLARAVGEGDKLFGSVSNRDVAEALAAEGIVGVQLSQHNHAWGGHTTEFFAVGTAVRPIRPDHVVPAPRLVLGLER